MVVLQVNLASSSPSGRARSPARAGNRRFWLLSTLRAHTKVPYKIDLHRKTLIVLNRPGRARTVQSESACDRARDRGVEPSAAAGATAALAAGRRLRRDGWQQGERTRYAGHASSRRATKRRPQQIAKVAVTEPEPAVRGLRRVPHSGSGQRCYPRRDGSAQWWKKNDGAD